MPKGVVKQTLRTADLIYEYTVLAKVHKLVKLTVDLVLCI